MKIDRVKSDKKERWRIRFEMFGFTKFEDYETAANQIPPKELKVVINLPLRSMTTEIQLDKPVMYTLSFEREGVNHPTREAYYRLSANATNTLLNSLIS